MSKGREAFENGDAVIAFMCENLVHGPGDHGGEPWRPVEWQADFIRRWFERKHTVLRGDQRRYRNGVLLTPKGCGKTELAGALAVVEMVNRQDADVVVAAASWAQASLLMDSAAQCCSHPNSDLAGYVTVTEQEIRRNGTSSKIQRVASDAGSNDGLRPTAMFIDELHEWNTDPRERNYEVLIAGAAKRSAPVLVTSTVGADRDLLLGRLVDVQERGNDETSLYTYHGAEGLIDDLNLDDPDGFREAVLRANPSARGDDAFVDLEEIVARGFELRPAARRRYYLNIWGEGGDEAWLPEGRWKELVDCERQTPDGAPLYLGFDGSVRGDSTAIVGVTVDEDNKRPHVAFVRVWEGGGKVIPRLEVQAEIESLFDRFDARLLYADQAYWWEEIRVWQERYGELRPMDGSASKVTVSEMGGAGRRATQMRGKVLACNTNRAEIWAESCGITYAAIVDGRLTHNGDEMLARHLRNAKPRESKSGLREYITFEKAYSDSKRKIDAGVALTLAMQAWHDWRPPVEPNVYWI